MASSITKQGKKPSPEPEPLVVEEEGVVEEVDEKEQKKPDAPQVLAIRVARKNLRQAWKLMEHYDDNVSYHSKLVDEQLRKAVDHVTAINPESPELVAQQRAIAINALSLVKPRLFNEREHRVPKSLPALIKEAYQKVQDLPTYTGMPIGPIESKLRAVEAILTGVKPDKEGTEQITVNRLKLNAVQILLGLKELNKEPTVSGGPNNPAQAPVATPSGVPVAGKPVTYAQKKKLTYGAQKYVAQVHPDAWVTWGNGTTWFPLKYAAPWLTAHHNRCWVHPYFNGKH